MPTGLGDEQLWISATNDNTGTSTAFNDQSGNSNNGTPLRTTVVADTSEGGTYAFNFINASLQKIDIPTLDLTGLSNFTWSAWIYDDSPNAVNTHSTFFSWSTTSAQEDILFIDYERSELVFQINDGVDGGNVYAQVNFQNWHHYCVTFDGSNPVATDRFKYYLDGAVQTPSSTFSYPSTLGNSGTNMGAIVGTYVSNQSPIFWFNGRQDDIRAYNRTITQAEITHLAEARGIEGPPPVGLGDEQLWLCPSINDSAADISGNGNDGTYNGGMGTVADTSNGGSLAYDFDGSDDYIQSSGPDNWTQQSVSFWMQTTGSAEDFPRLVEKGFNNEWTVALNKNVLGGKSKVTVQVGSGNYNAISTTDIDDGAWHHVTAVIDAAYNVDLYVDGVLEDSGSGTSNSKTGDVFIGGTPSFTSANFDGLIDDVRIYDRALTQAEITHLASQRGVEGPPPVGLGDEQLWFSASLNSGGGDLSGNGNDATLSAGVTTASPPSGSTDVAWFASGTGHSLNMDDAGLELRNANNATGKISLSFWVLPAATTNRRTFGSTQGTDTRLRTGRTTGGTVYSTWRSSGNSIASGTNGTTTTEMTHFVMLWENNAFARSYVNGVLQGEDLTVGSFVFGQDLAAYEYPLDGIAGTGYIDDIRGYDRILTQAEITHLATSRGIEGSPSTTTQYNAFITHAFKQLFQTRLR